ncbi:KAP family P-loop NTPase fold protein [Hominifimenecus sp. rT4P-3]|uniref:KAP family P-loop NTPase fold protein n=1 Tax=Hominifimenecus sp. rT4P-3 TaxID=3242979 RepID=UPI003DA4137B
MPLSMEGTPCGLQNGLHGAFRIEGKYNYEKGNNNMKKYKKYNIEATDDFIKRAIENDTYSRASSIKNFIEGLDLIDTNVFISLDAKWGEGKTFYIRQIEMTLKYLSKKRLEQDVSDLEETFSKSVLKSINMENTYFPIYYNAWLYDCHTDPLMSLLYVLIKECEKYVSTTINTKSRGDTLISLLSSCTLSLPFVQISGDFEKIKQSFTGKDILEEIKTAEELKDTVKKILNEILIENSQKLVIFIDELDRCKPSYAVEMLERIKHYFDDERIIFIASLNKAQLVHTISKFYGESFDSTGYLNKFFDINIYLPEIPKHLKANDILQTNDGQYLVRQIVEDLSEYYNLSLRDTIIFKGNMNSTSKQNYCDYLAHGCILSIFVPIIQVLDIVSQKKKNEFIYDQGEIFEELCKNVRSIHRAVCKFGGSNLDSEESYKIGFEKIFKVYKCTFGKEKQYDGSLEIPRDLKNICLRVCNGE